MFCNFSLIFGGQTDTLTDKHTDRQTERPTDQDVKAPSWSLKITLKQQSIYSFFAYIIPQIGNIKASISIIFMNS